LVWALMFVWVVGWAGVVATAVSVVALEELLFLGALRV
jgi:hypothetical protein